MAIVLRATKGSPLTHNEVDNNFTELDAGKIAKSILANNSVVFKNSTGDIVSLVVPEGYVLGRKVGDPTLTLIALTDIGSGGSDLFLGTFISLGALQAAHPAPDPGSSAHVDAGAGNEVKVYIWDDDDSEYVLQLGESNAETAASVKTKYESNANTNAYTDAEKTKLAALNENNVFNNQVGTTYTLQLSDNNKVVTCNNAADITVTIPLNATVPLPLGAEVTLIALGVGRISFVGEGAVVIKSADGYTKTRVQNSSVTAVQIAIDTWVLMGDLDA